MEIGGKEAWLGKEKRLSLLLGQRDKKRQEHG
jgi:hypothetical protein